ncbi:hypothetical protein ACQ4PT_022746 [Festuca glaucescens]
MATSGTVYVQVGYAFRDHVCWERPEDMDIPRDVYKVDPAYQGSDIAAKTAAALAAASIVFWEADPAYSKHLLDRAVVGVVWLHKASRQRIYRDYIKRNEVALRASESINEFGWDNKHAWIYILISKLQTKSISSRVP